MNEFLNLLSALRFQGYSVQQSLEICEALMPITVIGGGGYWRVYGPGWEREIRSVN